METERILQVENEALDAIDSVILKVSNWLTEFKNEQVKNAQCGHDLLWDKVIEPHCAPVLRSLEPHLHFTLDIIEALACLAVRYIPRSFYECRSNVRFKWEVFVFGVTMYSCISIPFRLTFGEFGGSYVWGLNMICDFIYLSEMPLNFKSGYIDDGLLVMNAQKCRQHYWKTWFFYDLMAFFPLKIAVWLTTGYNIPALERVPRLTRMLRFEYYFSMFEMRSSAPDTIRLGKLFLIMFILIHWVCCAYYFIGLYEGLGSTEFVPNSKYADPNLGVGSKYLVALYFSTAVLTGIGNIANPQTDLEIWFCLFCMVTGFLLFATIIGNIGEVLSNMHATVAQFRQKMSLVEEYMNQRNIPKDVQIRIRQHYGYLADRHQYLDDNAILEEMPSYLKREIALFMNYETLMKVNIFKDSEPGFINSLVLKLRAEVFSPNTYVFRKGEIGNEMFFICKGSVEICSEDGKTIYAVLSEGSYFGEVAILLKERRTASVRAKTFCDLFSLSKQDLFEVISDYPEQAAKMLKEAEARITMTRGTKTNFEARKEWKKAATTATIALAMKPKAKRKSVMKLGSLNSQRMGVPDEMIKAAKKHELNEVNQYAKAVTHSTKRASVALGVAHCDEMAHALRRTNSAGDIPQEKHFDFEITKKDRISADRQREKLFDLISTLNKAHKDTGHYAPPKLVRKSVTSLLLGSMSKKKTAKASHRKQESSIPTVNLSQKDLINSVSSELVEIVARSSGNISNTNSLSPPKRSLERRNSLDVKNKTRSRENMRSRSTSRRNSIQMGTPASLGVPEENLRKYVGIGSSVANSGTSIGDGSIIGFEDDILQEEEVPEEYLEEISELVNASPTSMIELKLLEEAARKLKEGDSESEIATDSSSDSGDD
eukprot:Nk52_evm27s913 gene=Nk52_evmTU27s913